MNTNRESNNGVATIARSILELQEGANSQLKPAEYKELAFDILSRHVPCESGIWAEGRLERNLGVIHDSYLYKFPEDSFLESYSRYATPDLNDELLNKVISDPGVTYDLRETVSAQFFETPLYTEHCKAFGIENGINSAVYWDDLDIFSSIAIYRSDINDVFSERERAYKEAITPNMVEGLRTCLRNALMNADPAFSFPEAAIALVDHTGLAHHVTTRFSDVFQTEVVKERPVSIDEFARNILLGEQQAGDFIVETEKVSFGLIVIRLIPVAHWGELSSRQKTVARKLATNAEYTEIADELHISRSTVTNHANEIYRILQVRNKFELSSLLRGGNQ